MKVIVIAPKHDWGMINVAKVQRDLEALLSNEIATIDPLMRTYAAEDAVSVLISAAMTSIGAILLNEVFIVARVDCVNRKIQVVVKPTAGADEVNAFLHGPRPDGVLILAVVADLVEIKDAAPCRQQPDGTLPDDWKAFTEYAERMGIGVAEEEWKPYWKMFTYGIVEGAKQ